MSIVHSNYPGRTLATVELRKTLGPRGYVGMIANDGEDGAVLYFTPKRARKLARKIVKAADRAAADLAAER